MKKLFLLSVFTFVTFVTFSQWNAYSVRAYCKANDYFVVKNADNAGTQKLTRATLFHSSDSTREAIDDTLAFNAGLGTDYTYQLATGSNYLNAAGFSALSLSQNIHNATLILDSLIGTIDLWTVGTGTYSVTQSNCKDTATGNYAVAINYENEAQGDASFAHGTQAVAWKATMKAFSSGGTQLKGVPQWGANQHVEVVQYLQTTDATADTLTIAGVDNLYLNIPTDMIGNFTVTIVGSTTSGVVGTSTTKIITGGIKNIAGTTSLIGTVDTLASNFDAAAIGWLVSVTGDNTSDALIVQVKGKAATTIHWTAHVKMTCVGIRNFSIE